MFRFCYAMAVVPGHCMVLLGISLYMKDSAFGIPLIIAGLLWVNCVSHHTGICRLSDALGIGINFAMQKIIDHEEGL